MLLLFLLNNLNMISGPFSKFVANSKKSSEFFSYSKPVIFLGNIYLSLSLKNLSGSVIFLL